MRRYLPTNYLFEIIVIIGVAVLVYAIGFPIYKAVTQPSLQEPVYVEDSRGSETDPEEFFGDTSTYRRVEGDRDSDSQRKKKRGQQAGQSQPEEEYYEAPIQSPLIYTPAGERFGELKEVEEEEEFVEEEEVREEVPLEFIEMSRSRKIDRGLDSVDLEEGNPEALDAKEAERLSQRERGQRLDLSDEGAGSDAEDAAAAAREAQKKLSAKDRRYSEKGWQKFSSHKGGFTVWVPNELYYIASTDPGRTEVYQSDANGIYYGLQRRKLERTYSGYGDAQMRRIFQVAYEEWKGDFAAGIPGFKTISKAFANDGQMVRTDVTMGADAGQIRLRIFVTENYMFWMWTVYLHERKREANHNMYINGIEIQKP